ncbi:MAG: hypothetical protein M3154_06575, partial [Candidatus Eremiobacteraeota bacterium]|nr:hypothetical protein [Candidatus Eremiobacteraeota bacterium]
GAGRSPRTRDLQRRAVFDANLPDEQRAFVRFGGRQRPPREHREQGEGTAMDGNRNADRGAVMLWGRRG